MRTKEIAAKAKSTDGKIEVAVQFWEEKTDNELKEFKFQDPSAKEIEAVIEPACEQNQKIELYVALHKDGKPAYELLDVVDTKTLGGDSESVAIEIEGAFEDFYEEMVALEFQEANRKTA